jgi:hypothetical protein
MGEPCPWYAGMMGHMGRRASTSTGRTSLDLDERLKMRASLFALKHGTTLTALVARGLELAMQEIRDQAKSQKPPKKPEQPRLLP